LLGPHPRILIASVLGGGEDIRTLAALTANRRVSPTALGSPTLNRIRWH
jgi:hypothetical protein